MSKYLIIAGHGMQKNGAFDPGATGFIKRGEHRYMTEVLFPAMQKYADDRFIFFSKYNVYNYGNVVSLAKKYNADVIEFHFDAAVNRNAKGGHVIVNQGFVPDKMDIRLRDALASTIGVFSAYKHRGYGGISGRSDLANVNRTGAGGVNYRLVELGFGTNKHDADYMMNHVDKLAKALVEAIGGTKPLNVKPSRPVEQKQPSKPSSSVAGGNVLHLPKNASTWRVYRVNGPYTKGNEIGFLRPAKFGGLTYEIKGVRPGNVYIIDTLDYGRVAIYAGGETGARISTKKAVSPKKGKQLILPKTAPSWRVYKVGGPYTKGNEIGFLRPAKFGGLKYSILGNPAPNVYIIQTQDFGKVAIYAGKETGATIK